MSAFWERVFDNLFDPIFGPAPTAAEEVVCENIRLKAIKRTRELEAENAALREELGL